MVGGIALGVTGVITYFAPALFSATAATVAQTGSFFVTTYGLAGLVRFDSANDQLRTVLSCF